MCVGGVVREGEKKRAVKRRRWAVKHGRLLKSEPLSSEWARRSQWTQAVIKEIKAPDAPFQVPAGFVDKKKKIIKLNILKSHVMFYYW